MLIFFTILDQIEQIDFFFLAWSLLIIRKGLFMKYLIFICQVLILSMMVSCGSRNVDLSDTNKSASQVGDSDSGTFVIDPTVGFSGSTTGLSGPKENPNSSYSSEDKPTQLTEFKCQATFGRDNYQIYGDKIEAFTRERERYLKLVFDNNGNPYQKGEVEIEIEDLEEIETIENDEDGTERVIYRGSFRVESENDEIFFPNSTGSEKEMIVTSICETIERN